MSTHNIGFYEDLTKIIFEYYQISSDKHLISSAGSNDTCIDLRQSICVSFHLY